jgi:DNA-binding response OmpR family regulator
MNASPRILAVDDTAPNLRLLEAVLVPKGYDVVSVESGTEALAEAAKGVDMVLLDVHLPDLSGFEVCQRLRSDPGTAALPILMITATATEERVEGLEAGADDFVAKPFNQAELLARVRSLLRVKRYHDELVAHRLRLAERIEAQKAEIDRLNELRRFLPETVLEAISRDDSLLEPHRQDVAVLFADLRGFTVFAGTAEPEEVIDVLRDYHAMVEHHVHSSGATVGHFAGDGVMLFWNDPLPCDDPAGTAVRTALRLVEDVGVLNESWRRLGYSIGVGIGVASGYATIGMMGFEGRYEYSALGPVVNLASRLSDEARGGHTILVNQRTHALLEERLVSHPLPDGLVLPGFPGPVSAWHVDRLDDLALAGAVG